MRDEFEVSVKNRDKREREYWCMQYRGKFNFIEIIFTFFLFAFMALFRAFDPIIGFFYGRDYHSQGDNALFISFVLTLLSVSFSLIYGVSPIQFIIMRLLRLRILDDTPNDNIKSSSLVSSGLNDSADDYLVSLVLKSERLSNRIFSLSQLYLLLGVVFSIFGLIFFYVNSGFVDHGKDVFTEMLILFPKFGVLVFIELISFFFLRQYRVSMDEFRYYESIKRHREEYLAIMKMLKSGSHPVDQAMLFEKIAFSSDVGKLNSGQSTELLESKKFDKNEMEFVLKIFESAMNKLGGSK